MKRVLTLVAALALASCGSDEPDFTQPSTDFSFQNVCASQASGLPPSIVFAEELELLQASYRDGGEAALTPYQSNLLHLLTESSATEFEGVSVVPQRIGSVFEPGVSTLADLQEGAGIREVQVYARLATFPLDNSRTSTLADRYEDSLLGHCDSFFEEDIRVACEEGQDGTACFRLERIERRDLGVIAEACGLAPYMLLCEPEDPPPYDLPRINEG